MDYRDPEFRVLRETQMDLTWARSFDRAEQSISKRHQPVRQPSAILAKFLSEPDQQKTRDRLPHCTFLFSIGSRCVDQTIPLFGSNQSYDPNRFPKYIGLSRHVQLGTMPHI